MAKKTNKKKKKPSRLYRDCYSLDYSLLRWLRTRLEQFIYDSERTTDHSRDTEYGGPDYIKICKESLALLNKTKDYRGKPIKKSKDADFWTDTKVGDKCFAKKSNLQKAMKKLTPIIHCLWW